jgi:DsbC/DsbD-like thiol-disulfide interchange protein
MTMFMRGFLLAALFSGLIATQLRAGHVQADLLSDVSAVQPGKPFWLGVRLTIDDGWHVYWKNAGDAGLPTRIKLKLPDGFTAGPIQFPAPHRFVQPGNIVIFGYEGTVMLLAKITPPATLPADFQGQFVADVSWLVCSQEICLPGKASLNQTLSLASSPQPNNQELFQDWVGQLPVDPAQNPEIAGVNLTTWRWNGKTCTISISWSHAAPASAEFIPDAEDDFTISPVDVKSSQNTTVITFTATPLAGTNPGPTTLQAVLSFKNDQGKQRGINISVALPR